MAKVKCAQIYLEQTTTSKGNYSGSVAGVGLTSGGLGVGVGGTSGTTHTESKSKLAEMFAPVYDDVNFYFDFKSIFLSFIGLIMWKSMVSLLFNNNQIVLFGGWIFFSLGILFYFIQLFKSLKESKNDNQNNYESILYDTELHMIEYNNMSLTPSRENFIKLVRLK